MQPAAITYEGRRRYRRRRPGRCGTFRLARRRRTTADPDAITFHEYGRLVMWPYGYTTPMSHPIMTAGRPRRARGDGKYMAASNGYKPNRPATCTAPPARPATSSTGRTRIFSYTFEIVADDGTTASSPRRRTGTRTPSYTSPNGWCRKRGRHDPDETWRCGAFDDDFEAARERRRTRTTSMADERSVAAWQPRRHRVERAQAVGSVLLGRALTTGLTAGATVNANDLDGRSTVRSGLSTGCPRRMGSSSSSATSSRTARRSRRLRTSWSCRSRRPAGADGGVRHERRDPCRRRGGTSTRHSGVGGLRRSASIEAERRDNRQAQIDDVRVTRGELYELLRSLTARQEQWN